MNQTLKKNTLHIQKILNNAEIEYCVLELPTSTGTATDAALSIGCNLSQIVKSLIFKTQKTNRPVLVLVSGSNRVNEEKIEMHTNEKIVKADADFTKDITGFAIGGIPPIGHKQEIKSIFIDQDLLKFDEVWAAAGTQNSVFRIKSKNLLSITKGRVISIN